MVRQVIMKIHYVDPMYGYHEVDDFNPIWCGLENIEVPAATSKWEDVSCLLCLARRKKITEKQEAANKMNARPHE